MKQLRNGGASRLQRLNAKFNTPRLASGASSSRLATRVDWGGRGMRRIVVAAIAVIATSSSVSAADKTCDIRYLANGGGGKTLVSCGVGDLIQIAGAASNEMRPLPGEYATARIGEVLYRETARVAVTTAVLAESVDATVGAAGPIRFQPGDELRQFAVADRKAFCRVDRAALDAATAQAMTRNRGPFVGISYAAACLVDSDGDGAFDGLLARPLGQSRFQAVKIKAAPYDLRTEHHLAVERGAGAPRSVMMSVKLLSASADEARLEFPVWSGVARDAFSRTGLPVRKDKMLVVPLVDGRGDITERGLTIEIRSVSDAGVDYVVRGGIAQWFGVEQPAVALAPAPAMTGGSR